MGILNLLSADRISIASDVASKKRAIEVVSKILITDDSPITAGEVFDGLLMRERLGSTGLGKGIAIPHARVSGCEQAVGAILKLSDGVDFDSVDRAPVDIFFGLIVPEQFTNEHLELLAELASLFSDSEFCAAIRAADDAQTIYQLFEKQLSP